MYLIVGELVVKTHNLLPGVLNRQQYLRLFSEFQSGVLFADRCFLGWKRRENWGNHLPVTEKWLECDRLHTVL